MPIDLNVTNGQLNPAMTHFTIFSSHIHMAYLENLNVIFDMLFITWFCIFVAIPLNDDILLDVIGLDKSNYIFSTRTTNNTVFLCSQYILKIC